MAIKAAPGYSAAATRARQQASAGYLSPMPNVNVTVPKAAPIKIPPAVGYGSGTGTNYGGWGYPASTPKPLLPGVPAASVPASNVNTVPSSQPSAAQTLGANPYVGEITSDPLYGLGMAQRDATLNALGMARQTGIQQDLIAGGYAPGELNQAAFGEYAGDVTPETIAAIGQNQFSTKAQLTQGLNQQMAAMPYDLARRGASRSGAAQTHATSYNQAFQSQSNQAMQALADKLSGRVTGYLSGRTQAEQTWMDAQQTIASRLAQIAGYSQATDEYGNPEGGDINQDVIPPELGGGGSVNGIVAPRLTPAVRTALVSPNAATRAKAAASAGFISPTPNVAVSKAIAAVRKKK